MKQVVESLDKKERQELTKRLKEINPKIKINIKGYNEPKNLEVIINMQDIEEKALAIKKYRILLRKIRLEHFKTNNPKEVICLTL